MTEQALDDLLRQVMLDAARQEYGDLIDEQPEHDFSPAFEKKMNKLIRRAKHPVWHNFVHAAACVLLALLLTSCAVLAVSPEAREALTGWVREVYENYFVYRYAGPEETKPEDVGYLPSWVPEGYEVEFQSMTNDGSTIIYRNEEGKLIVFVVMKSGGVIQVDAVNPIQTVVNGSPAELYLDPVEGGANVLIWEDEAEETMFRIIALLSGEEIIKMAESVGPVRLETAYRLSWIPEGYTLKEEIPIPGQMVMEYEGKTGSIDFLYFTSPSAGQAMVGPEPEEPLQASVNGYPAEIYLTPKRDHKNMILWSNEEGIFFMIRALESKEDLIRMAESVESFKHVVSRQYVYIPNWIPEGYKTVSKDFSERGQNILRYETEQGDLLTVIYTGDIDAGALYLEQGEAKRTAVSVSGLPADLYLDPQEGGANALVWQDGERLTWISGPLTEEELIRVAESMEPVKWPERLEEHRLAWVPGSYREIARDILGAEDQGYVMYQNQEGYVISFLYVRQAESALPQVSSISGRLEARTVQVNGRSADLYLEEGKASALVWPDSRTGMLFMIQATCSEEELVKMAESVEVVPKEFRAAWLPEGYTLVHKFGEDSKSHKTFLYENENRETIILLCGGEESNKLYLSPNEDHIEKKVSIGGCEGDLFLATTEKLNSELVWSNPETGTIFTLSAALPENTLLQIARSVQELPELQSPRLPTWIPEGYRIISEASGYHSMELEYVSEKGNQIQYQYARDVEVDERRTEIQEAVEGLESRDILVNGFSGKLYEHIGGISHLVWAGTEPDELYWISAPLSSEELIWIAESVGATEQNES